MKKLISIILSLAWKAVQRDEFVDEVNARFANGGAIYTEQTLGIDGYEGDALTFGMCKTAFAVVLEDNGLTGTLTMEEIIKDTNYWSELDKWNDSTDPDKEDWNPDNWDRRWNDLDEMLDIIDKELNPGSNA